jgi:hypothetical protein
MTVGALIFAINNDATDYKAMANWSADNIKRHLGIPTHVVTDYDNLNSNHRHFSDLGHVAWHNTSRPDAYDLSPWDRTLLLDADYVVASDQLKVLLDVDRDFLAHRSAFDVTGCNNFHGLNHFGAHDMPMSWATVIMFRRSALAADIFQCMRMIRDNWTHYRNIYKIRSVAYRNDHALTIAQLICSGHDLSLAAIPWPLASLTPEHRLVRQGQDRYRVDYINGENQNRYIEIVHDFHAMGKQQLEALIADQG